MKPEVLLLTLRSAHSLVLQCELRVALGGGREEAHVAVVLLKDMAFSTSEFYFLSATALYLSSPSL